MAANNFIQVNINTQHGWLAMRIRDLLVELGDKSDELANALAQVAADDTANSTTVMQTALGITTSYEDAQAVQTLVTSVQTQIHDANNAFLQYMSRINRT